MEIPLSELNERANLTLEINITSSNNDKNGTVEELEIGVESEVKKETAKIEKEKEIEKETEIEKDMKFETRKVAPGVDMPAISLAVDEIFYSRYVKDSLDIWLKLGGRGIDISNLDQRSVPLKEAIQLFVNGNHTREELFLTTAIETCNEDELETAFKDRLKQLGTDYVDMLLLAKNPAGDATNCALAWKKMESFFASKQARVIGVKHFEIASLKEIMKAATIVPHVNQIDFNVLHNIINHRTIEFCMKNSIHLQSNSFDRIDGAVVEKIAENYGVSNVKVAIKWILQHGWSLTYVPRHKKVEAEYYVVDVSNFELTNDEMNELDELDSLQSKDLDIETKLIATGVEMPEIVLGYYSPKNVNWDEVHSASLDWLGLGGYGFDVRQYHKKLGKTLEQLSENIARKNIFFIVTLDCDSRKFHDNFNNILNDLQTDYVDLLLLNGHGKNVESCRAAWIKVEELFISEKAHSTGIKDFTKPDLQQLIRDARLKPHVNYLNINIFRADPDLVKFSTDNDIHLHSYSPGENDDHPFSENSSVERISYDRGVSPDQIAHKWILQHGWSLTLDVNRFNMSEADFSGFTLTNDEMNVLNVVSGLKREEKFGTTTTTIASGVDMPVISIECEKSTDREKILEFYDLGGRAFDCLHPSQLWASLDRNVIIDTPSRKDLFITYRVNCGYEDGLLDNLNKTLGQLRTNYFDLLILEYTENKDCLLTWQNMEKALVRDQVRVLGVKNYGKELLESLVKNSRMKPVVNQIDWNIFKTDSELLEYMSREGILLHSYSPLGSGDNITQSFELLSEDPTIQMISQQHGVIPYQIVMKWILQHEWSLTFDVMDLPASDVILAGFSLTKKEMKELDGITNLKVPSSQKNEFCRGSLCISSIAILVSCLFLVVALLIRRNVCRRRYLHSKAEHLNRRGDGLYRDFAQYRDNPTQNKLPPEGMFRDFPMVGNVLGEDDMTPIQEGKKKQKRHSVELTMA